MIQYICLYSNLHSYRKFSLFWFEFPLKYDSLWMRLVLSYDMMIRISWTRSMSWFDWPATSWESPSCCGWAQSRRENFKISLFSVANTVVKSQVWWLMTHQERFQSQAFHWLAKLEVCVFNTPPAATRLWDDKVWMWSVWSLSVRGEGESAASGERKKKKVKRLVWRYDLTWRTK